MSNRCAKCDDTGYDPDGGYCRCSAGGVAEMWDGGKRDCTMCGGSGGGQGSQRCPRCRGRGWFRLDRDGYEIMTETG